MQNTKQKSGTKQKLTIAAIFGAMGPGLLAALSGNDAGGIATYSSAGASYGYKMLWMLPVMTVLLIVTQETAARCGCVTGQGPGIAHSRALWRAQECTCYGGAVDRQHGCDHFGVCGHRQRPCSLWRAGEHLGAVGGAAGVDAYHVG